MSNGEIMARTLALVNVFRTAMKWVILRSLPKGRLMHPEHCTLNRAVNGHGVGVSYIGFSDTHMKRVADITWFGEVDYNTIRLTRIPLVIQEFLSRYDRGLYPELLEP